MNWVVYALKNPRTNEIRYVGQTSQKTATRLRQHLRLPVSKPRTLLHNWIQELFDEQLIPLMEVIESGTGDGWAEAERRWIAFYRALGARLVNGTDGGDGTPGRVLSPELRKRLAELARKQWAALSPEQRSAVVPPEVRKRLGELTKKRWAAMSPQQRSATVSPERRKRMSEAGRTRWAAMSPEQRDANPFAKLTPEQRTANSKKAFAAIPIEQRRAAFRKALAGIPIEKRIACQQKHTERLLAIHASRTVEQLRAMAKKTNDLLTPAKRSEAGKKAHSLKSPEERSAIVAKGHATRRINHL